MKYDNMIRLRGAAFGFTIASSFFNGLWKVVDYSMGELSIFSAVFGVVIMILSVVAYKYLTDMMMNAIRVETSRRLDLRDNYGWLKVNDGAMDMSNEERAKLFKEDK